METKDKFDELMEKAAVQIDILFKKMHLKPKYILGHTFSDKYQIESFEERIKILGFQKTENGVWISNVTKDNLERKELISNLKQIKKFILGNQKKIILIINENNEREKVTI